LLCVCELARVADFAQVQPIYVGVRALDATLANFAARKIGVFALGAILASRRLGAADLGASLADVAFAALVGRSLSRLF
jgi:hypothetical protein